MSTIRLNIPCLLPLAQTPFTILPTRRPLKGRRRQSLALTHCETWKLTCTTTILSGLVPARVMRIVRRQCQKVEVGFSRAKSEAYPMGQTRSCA